MGAVLVGCGFGFWVDSRWETGPWGVLVGVVIGFAAMVLRLVRLGKELNPDTVATDETGADGARIAPVESAGRRNPTIEDELGVAVEPGMSDVLRDGGAKQSEAVRGTDASPRKDPSKKETE